MFTSCFGPFSSHCLKHCSRVLLNVVHKTRNLQLYVLSEGQSNYVKCLGNAHRCQYRDSKLLSETPELESGPFTCLATIHHFFCLNWNHVPEHFCLIFTVHRLADAPGVHRHRVTKKVSSLIHIGQRASEVSLAKSTVAKKKEFDHRPHEASFTLYIFVCSGL